MTSVSLLSALRTQLGTEVIHQGVHCRLLEVLDDGPLLILQDSEEHTMIQENQYGGLWRRVPQHYTIPVFTNDGRNFHPLFTALNLSITPH